MLFMAIAVLAQKTAQAGWSPYFTKPVKTPAQLVEILEKGDPQKFLKIPLAEYKKQKMALYNKDKSVLNSGNAIDTDEELLAVEKTMYFTSASFKEGELSIYRTNESFAVSTWERPPYKDEYEIKSSLNNKTYQLSVCGNPCDDLRPSSYEKEVKGTEYDSIIRNTITINDTIINRYEVNERVVYQTTGGWYASYGYNRGYYYYPYRPYWFWNYGYQQGWYNQPSNTTIVNEGDYYNYYYSDDDITNITNITNNTIDKVPIDGEPADVPTHDDGGPSGNPTHDDPPIIDDGDTGGPVGTPTHDDGGGMQGDGSNKTEQTGWTQTPVVKNSLQGTVSANTQPLKVSGIEKTQTRVTGITKNVNPSNTTQTKQFANTNPLRVTTTQNQKQANVNQFNQKNPSREYLNKTVTQKQVPQAYSQVKTKTTPTQNILGQKKILPQANNSRSNINQSGKTITKSQPQNFKASQSRNMSGPKMASAQKSAPMMKGGGSMGRR